MEQVCVKCEATSKGLLSGAKFVDSNLLNDLKEAGIKDAPECICTKCYCAFRDVTHRQIWDEIKSKKEDIEKLKNEIKKELSKIEILTYPPTPGMEYEAKGIISSFSAMGTGLFTEVVSGWTDFFGVESETYHKKLDLAQNNCFDRLRYSAVEKDADCVIGTHITYTELTAGKGMILVCACGTAIKRRGTLPNKTLEHVEEIKALNESIKANEKQFTALQNV